MKRFLWACATSLAALALPAFGQESGWYVGGAIGQSKFKFDRGAIEGPFAAAGLGTTGFTYDETDTAWKLFGGYKFNRYFALEGAYLDLGKFSTSSRVISGAPPVNVSFALKTKEAFDLAAVGIVPIGSQFSVFGKLGGYSIKTEGTGSGATTVTGSDRGTGVLWGVGVGYDFARNLGVRAEYELFDKVGNKDKTFEGDVRLLSLGLVYKF
jgi:OOP family OmpA-OmpF porin